MSTDGRRLLVAIVKGHRRLEQVLEGFVELELSGATVLDARGMGEIVATEIPVFSGFRALFSGGTEESYVIISVLTGDQIREAMALLRDVCGDFAERGTGIVFTLPIEEFHGPPVE
jgi:hypothetical protein